MRLFTSTTCVALPFAFAALLDLPTFGQEPVAAERKTAVATNQPLELTGSLPDEERREVGLVPAQEGTASFGELRLVSKASLLVGSLTVFLLAIFVGFEVITKVPPTLHTPLMSGSNAISGITIVGAILTAGHVSGGFGSWLGMLAVVLAIINVVGGFLVTHRMLIMFKKR